MTARPIGKLDHIGIAVNAIAAARGFFEEVLGARFCWEHENPEAGYKICVFELNGLTLELLEPLGESSFLHRFLASRGEGLHHLTFNVPEAREKVRELKERGVRIVEEKQWSDTSYEAFISPRSAHGILIQIGSGYPTLDNDPAWTSKRSTPA
jgi:methylmalonyl-CoA/ethylmalonyl-CoA epimerase